MISFPRRRATVIVSGTVAVAVGAVIATTSLAGAATSRPDLAVSTSMLRFQPPATLPDTGTATIKVSNVGTVRSGAAILQLDTVSRLTRVTANGSPCRLVALSSGTDVARCTISATAVPAPRRSVTVAVSLELNSPPGNCSCVPFTVRLLVPGDSNPSDNVATGVIGR